MDFQAKLDSMVSAGLITRSDYHLTLGGLIDALDRVDGGIVVQFEDGLFPGSEASYRGYNEDLAFAPSSEPCTVGEPSP